MAYEALAWALPPVSTDNNDGGQAYSMGIKFHPTEDLPCAGIEWRVPDTVSAPPGALHTVSLYQALGQILVAQAEFTPVPGTTQRVLFTTPVPLEAGLDYVAAVYTVHYVYRASGNVYPSTPSGKVVSDEGRLLASAGGPAFPNSATGLLFYVSPVVGTDEAPEPEVHTTAGTAFGALSATASRSTARATAAAAPATVGASAARTSRRLTSGRAEAVADARSLAGTARRTSGAARALLTARSAQVRGASGGGPRLISSTHGGTLASASRPDVITTSTRG